MPSQLVKTLVDNSKRSQDNADLIKLFTAFLQPEVTDDELSKLTLAACGCKIVFDETEGITFVLVGDRRLPLTELIDYMGVLRQLFPVLPGEDADGSLAEIPAIALPGVGGDGGGSPTGDAGGDLAGMYPNPTLKPTGATAGNYSNVNVTLNNKGQITAISSGSNSPGGAAGGDLAGAYPNPTLAAISGLSAGVYTNPISTMVDGKGRVVAMASAPVNIAYGTTPPIAPTDGDLFFDQNAWINQPYQWNAAKGLWLGQTLAMDLGSNSFVTSGTNNPTPPRPTINYGTAIDRIYIARISMVYQHQATNSHTSTDYYSTSIQVRNSAGTDVNLFNLATTTNGLTSASASSIIRTFETVNLWIPGNSLGLRIFATKTESATISVNAIPIIYYRLSR